MNFHIFLSSLENETRLYKEARYLLERGLFDRVVVAGLWAKGLKTEETTDYGLEIRRLKTLIRRYADTSWLRHLTLLRKLVAALSMLQLGVMTILLSLRARPSHVSCHNVLLLPVAWAAARLGGARLIYLPHELETQRSGLTGIARESQAWIERHFIHAAAEVVVVCDPIADWYKEAYGLARVHVIRNVPEQDAVAIQKIPEAGFRERFAIPDSAMVFIYQGVFGKARGTDRLLEIFSRVDPQLGHLVLMGYGEPADEAEIDAFAALRSNIHRQPPVPRDLIVSYTCGADVGVWVIEDAPLSYRYALPNKFFEYAHAGVALLVTDNLAHQAGLLSEQGIGWACPYERVQETLDLIMHSDISPQRARARDYAKSAVWENDAKAYEVIYQ